MFNLLSDIAPYPRDWDRPPVVIRDTVDTVVAAGQQFSDSVQGGGSHSLPYILGGILAALVALGFLIFMVRLYRQRGEQQLEFVCS